MGVCVRISVISWSISKIQRPSWRACQDDSNQPNHITIDPTKQSQAPSSILYLIHNFARACAAAFNWVWTACERQMVVVTMSTKFRSMATLFLSQVKTSLTSCRSFSLRIAIPFTVALSLELWLGKTRNTSNPLSAICKTWEN